MLKIAIIGAGSMGTAFSVPCSDNGHEVDIVGTHLEDTFIENIRNNSNFHPALNVSVSSEINFCKNDKINSVLTKDLEFSSNLHTNILAPPPNVTFTLNPESRLYGDYSTDGRLT